MVRAAAIAPEPIGATPPARAWSPPPRRPWTAPPRPVCATGSAGPSGVARGTGRAGGSASAEPGRPHRPGDLQAGRGRPGRDRPGRGGRRRRAGLGRQPAGQPERRHRDRGRPRHRPGPADPPGVRVRPHRSRRSRPGLCQRDSGWPTPPSGRSPGSTPTRRRPPSRCGRRRSRSPPRRTPTRCGWRPGPRAAAAWWPASTRPATRSTTRRSACPPPDRAGHHPGRSDRLGGQPPGRHHLDDRPQNSEVGTIRLGFRPTAVAVDQGAVWVTLAA